MPHSQTVWKYPVNIGANEMAVPRGATVVHFGIDGAGNLCAWIRHAGWTGSDDDRRIYERIAPTALNDLRAPTEKQALTLYVAATGEELPACLAHQGTAVMDSGLVWHLFAWPA